MFSCDVTVGIVGVSLIWRKCTNNPCHMLEGAQWLGDRVLDSRSRGCGSEPH